MEAHCLSIQGVLKLETYQWGDALDLLLRSKFLFQKLGEGKDAMEATLYHE